MRLKRPVQARFHYGYPSPVNLATHRNSQAHSSKGTQSHHTPEGVTLLRLVSTRFQVLFHDPSPGCFSPFPHGTSSLSVAKEYLDLWGGPHRFIPVFTVPALLGMTGGGCMRFGYGAVTHCGRPFQSRSPTQQLVNSVVRLMPHLLVPRPRASNAIRLGTGTV